MLLLISQSIHILTFKDVIETSFLVSWNNTTPNTFADCVGCYVQHLSELGDVINDFLRVNQAPQL